MLYQRTTDLVQGLQIARCELTLESAIRKLNNHHLRILDDIRYVRKDEAETSAVRADQLALRAPLDVRPHPLPAKATRLASPRAPRVAPATSFLDYFRGRQRFAAPAPALSRFFGSSTIGQAKTASTCLPPIVGAE